MERISKTNYYLNIATEVASRSTCLRRHFGAVIVKSDQIISTGYNGAPRNRKNCCDLGECLRTKLGINHGEKYELCRSVHAEANAIIQASRKDMLDATMYLVGYEITETGERKFIKANPCIMCERFIINAGLRKLIISTPDLNDKENDPDILPPYEIIAVPSLVYDDLSLMGKGNYK